MIHCPYCAQPLREAGPLLYCDAASDEFSEWASRELLRGLEATPRAIPEAGAQPVTHWNCPRCVARMHRQTGKILGAQCAGCGYEMPSSLEYCLLELRTHPYSEEERAELEHALRAHAAKRSGAE